MWGELLLARPFFVRGRIALTTGLRHDALDSCQDFADRNLEDTPRLPERLALIAGTRLTIELVINDLVWSVSPRPPVSAI